MRTITKVLVVAVLVLLGFHAGRCSVSFGGNLAYANVEQPKPRPPLPAYEPGLESTVVVELDGGHCTGFIESDYILVTATHCLADGSHIVATTTYADGRFLRYANSGQIVANDGHDHVKVRMAHRLYGRHAKIVPMPPPGTPIYIYGHPSGTEYQLRTGMVTGQFRSGDNVLYDTIAMDSWHGDSGGAIYDKDGNVVGMVSGYFADFNPRAQTDWRVNVSQPWAFSGERIR